MWGKNMYDIGIMSMYFSYIIFMGITDTVIPSY